MRLYKGMHPVWHICVPVCVCDCVPIRFPGWVRECLCVVFKFGHARPCEIVPVCCCVSGCACMCYCMRVCVSVCSCLAGCVYVVFVYGYVVRRLPCAPVRNRL